MKPRDLLFLLVSSALLAGVWIAFTILHTALTSTISGTVAQQITQINGSFDTKTINALQKREQITPQVALQGTDNITNTPTPTLPPVNIINPIQSSRSANTQGGTTPTP